MMEAALGSAVDPKGQFRRGDLIFWKGHVGIMLDSERIIHANGFWMQVSIEPFKTVVARTIERESLPVRTVKRLS
jgi:cell wall-associated NlpC family hydrolase